MGKIVTVTGEIAPKQLGFCQSHEHLCIEDGESRRQNPDLLIDDPERTLAELHDFYRADGRAVVDAQPVGCGRNARTLKLLSEKSGVRVIASTGFHRARFYPADHWIHGMDEDALFALFTRELTEGMFTGCDNSPPEQITSIRAGQIKAALEGNPLDPRAQILFAAAARAARATGAPLMVHVERGSDPDVLADFLEARDVPLHRVILCHMDRAVDDLPAHLRLLKRGVWLEYDTIGRPKYHDDGREIEIIAAMTRAGYGEQLLAGLDVTRARYLAYGGQVGLHYLLKHFLPRLAAAIGEQAAKSIFTENAIRAFSRDTAHRCIYA